MTRSTTPLVSTECVRLGTKIQAGDPLLRIGAVDDASAKRVSSLLDDAFVFSENPERTQALPSFKPYHPSNEQAPNDYRSPIGSAQVEPDATQEKLRAQLSVNCFGKLPCFWPMRSLETCPLRQSVSTLPSAGCKPP